MLPRKYRVTKDKEYKNIFDCGIAVFCDFFIFKGVRNDLGFDRFGFIASLKVSKKAHIRTKIKRWLRESAGKILRKEIEDGFDVAVVAKKGAFEAGFNKLDKEMKIAFLRMMQIYERKKNYNKSDKNLPKNNISGS